MQTPGRERDERLDGKIELRSEAAADRGRDDAHSRRRDAENFGDIVAIHIGRLGAGLDLDAVADAARETGFRLDIGVLDKAGLECAFDENLGARHAGLDIAARDAAARQNVAAAAGRG